MRRRECIVLLGGTVATWPLVALGQSAATLTIGYLSTLSEAQATTQLAMGQLKAGRGQSKDRAVLSADVKGFDFLAMRTYLRSAP